MTQMLGFGAHRSRPEGVWNAGSSRKNNLALELLSGCGMILRARLRTSHGR